MRAWVDGLTGDDPALTGDGEAIRTLRQRLDRWAASGRAAPLRTCFRLSYVDEYPGEDAGGWLLEFLLQPLDEPSLLVPASQVWRDVASPLMRWADDPQEILLADLGRACRLYPDLEDVLRTAYPAQERLDLAGAYRFLTHANVLEDAGFGVLVPSVWQRRQDLGLTLTVRTGQPASPVLRDTTANRDAIVQYRWGLAIGAEFLSEHDLVELARAKVPLVRLRGRWVHLDRERLRAGPGVPGPRRVRGDDRRRGDAADPAGTGVRPAAAGHRGRRLGLARRPADRSGRGSPGADRPAGVAVDRAPPVPEEGFVVVGLSGPARRGRVARR